MVKERARLIVAGQLKDDTMELVDIRGLTGALPSLDQARAILVALGRPPGKRAFLAGTERDARSAGRWSRCCRIRCGSSRTKRRRGRGSVASREHDAGD